MLHNGINTMNTHNFAKVMFLHLFVSHSVHGGVPASVHAWIHTPPRQTPPQGRHPQGADSPPPGADSPWEQTQPPGADTPSGSRHPPQQMLPLHSACWEIRATSGWYASYWNAYLLKSVAFFCISAYLQCTECTT